LLVKWLKRISVIAALAALGFYAALNIFVYLYQENLLFYPCRDEARPPARVETVTFRTGDGETLHGWWMHEGTKRKTALFFHGNGGCVAGLGYQLDAIRKLGMNGLVFDYRGYGKSSGKIASEADLFEDGRAAIQFLHEHGISDSDIVLWGQSLGGGVAAQMATEGNFRALIFDSTFFSMEEMAAREYPYLPTGLLLKYPLRNGEKVAKVHTPTLVIHSREDGLVPYEQAERLFDAAAGPKTFLAIKGGHAGGYFDDPARYIGGIRDFLGKI